jgi:hypothetical protein
VLAQLAGADGIRSMTRWCVQHHRSLNELLGTRWERAPDFSTWRVLLKTLGKTDCSAALGTLPANAGDVLHIDGKALCGSVKNGSPITFMTSIFRGVDRVALTTRYHGEGEEAEAARQALERLCAAGNLKGVWFTFDALHTQKKQTMSSEMPVQTHSSQ